MRRWSGVAASQIAAISPAPSGGERLLIAANFEQFVGVAGRVVQLQADLRRGERVAGLQESLRLNAQHLQRPHSAAGFELLQQRQPRAIAGKVLVEGVGQALGEHVARFEAIGRIAVGPLF